MARVRLERAINVVAVMTAVSFPASAIIHTYTFFSWGLDFSSFGSLEDVVLGGFRLIAHWLMWKAIFVSLALAAITLVITAIFIKIVADESMGNRLYYVMFAYACFVLYFVLSLNYHITFDTFRAALRSVGTVYWVVTFLLALSLSAVSGFGNYKLWRIVSVADLPLPCDQQHRIWWIGARSTILECGGRPYVLITADRPMTYVRIR